MTDRPNDLDGKTWLQHSFSIWRDLDKTADERKLGHPAMFPTALTDRLIAIFTKKGDTVLDPFLGSGSTLVSAAKLGRKGIGVELSAPFVKLAASRLKNAKDCTVHRASIFDLGKLVPSGSVDFVVTSPPYWDILNQRRTADGKDIRTYSASKNDLGNIESYETFLTELGKAFKIVAATLKTGKYCAVVVMDIRKKSTFYPFHMDLCQALSPCGLVLDDIIIWDRQKEYNNMRPLGYPYVFRVNKVHEFVMIFKKV